MKLSGDGKINVFDSAGSVDVIADVVGYYAGHNHDDRYDTSPEVDAALATKVDKVAAPSVVHVNSLAFVPLVDAAINHTLSGSVFGGVGSSSGTCAGAAVTLPHGSTVTQFAGRLYDNSNAQVLIALLSDPAANVPGSITVTDATIASPTVDTTANVYSVLVCGLTPNSDLYDVSIALAPPA